MTKQYKKPLTLDKQIEHLKSQKNVVFNNYSEEEAMKILYGYNYINVISPFKHLFFSSDKNGIPLRDIDGNHIYPNPVDFKNYYDAYLSERYSYPRIYLNLMKFETIFNAILTYETVHFYTIRSSTDFDSFITSLIQNANSLKNNNEYSETVVNYMLDTFSSFHKKMLDYEDIYIFLDRLSLSEQISVFRCCDKPLRSKIFQSLMKYNVTLGYSTFKQFDGVLKRIVPIRNCICHFNSLEVLIEYRKIKTKELRYKSEKSIYKKIIARLSV